MKNKIIKKPQTTKNSVIKKEISKEISDLPLSILAMSVRLAKIRTKCLYRSLDCQNMAQYVQRLCEDTKMDQSNIYKWLYFGEAYLNDMEEARLYEQTYGRVLNDLRKIA